MAMHSHGHFFVVFIDNPIQHHICRRDEKPHPSIIINFAFYFLFRLTGLIAFIKKVLMAVNAKSPKLNTTKQEKRKEKKRKENALLTRRN
jgi:hypothetical protein